MRKTQETINIRSRIADYVNQNDIFWMSDLLKSLGLNRMSDLDGKSIAIVTTYIGVLVNNGILQCSDSNGVGRQYLRLKIIQDPEGFAINLQKSKPRLKRKPKAK